MDQIVGGLDFTSDVQFDSQISVIPYRALQPSALAFSYAPDVDRTPIIANAIVEETHTDDLEITDQPIDQGASITDHAYKRPAEVVLKLGFSNSVGYDGGYSTPEGETSQATLSGSSVWQVRDIYQKLLSLQSQRILLDVFTGKRDYINMLIKSLVTTTDAKTENVLSITITLRQAVIAQTRLINTAAPAVYQQNAEITNPPQEQGMQQVTEDPQTFDDTAAAEAADPVAMDEAIAASGADQLTYEQQNAIDAKILDGLTTYEIPMQPFAQTLQVALGGVTRNLGVSWNAISSSWSLDIADVAGNPLIQGISLVTGSDLLSQFDYLGIGGKLFVQTDGAPNLMPDFSTFGKLSHLYFLAK